MWTNKFEDLLLEWKALREQAAKMPIEDALTLVHEWWNKAPIVNYTVHFNDPENWPLPWDLLAQDGYCDVAKCLGICYTLLLTKHEDINSLHMVQTDNYTLVQVNEGQYTLNDQPDSITADISDLRIRYTYDCENLKSKIHI